MTCSNLDLAGLTAHGRIGQPDGSQRPPHRQCAATRFAPRWSCMAGNASDVRAGSSKTGAVDEGLHPITSRQLSQKPPVLRPRDLFGGQVLRSPK